MTTTERLRLRIWAADVRDEGGEAGVIAATLVCLLDILPSLQAENVRREVEGTIRTLTGQIAIAGTLVPLSGQTAEVEV